MSKLLTIEQHIIRIDLHGETKLHVILRIGWHKFTGLGSNQIVEFIKHDIYGNAILGV